MKIEPTDSHWHNRSAWDRLARKQDRLAKPARDEDFSNPLASVDGLGWLGGDVRGKRLLCLAAGGGRQGPIYAAAGADVTVVDLSPAMLELDREVSFRCSATPVLISLSTPSAHATFLMFDLFITKLPEFLMRAEFISASTSSQRVCKRTSSRSKEVIESFMVITT